MLAFPQLLKEKTRGAIDNALQEGGEVLLELFGQVNRGFLELTSASEALVFECPIGQGRERCDHSCHAAFTMSASASMMPRVVELDRGPCCPGHHQEYRDCALSEHRRA